MSHFYTAADFISDVDESLKVGKITEKERQLLLKDMSELVDNFNENDTNGIMNISFSNNHDRVSVITSWYNRFYEKGSTIPLEETWLDYQHRPHRLNGKPARIIYYAKGSPKSEQWWEYGKLSRGNDLPTTISYHPNGNVDTESWYVNDRLHRLGGKPAKVTYDHNNNVILTEKWENGRVISGLEIRRRG